jgi:hypothetical protein
MDDANDSETGRTRDPEKKKRKTLIPLVAAVVLVVGIAMAAGWIYFNATQTIRDQKGVVSDLKRQLKTFGVDVPDALGEEGEDESATGCSGGSVYKADIGNFVVTLSDPNVIVRTLDANFEGGPITKLSIGRCLAGATNVVDAYPTNEVTILGHPASDAATLRANFEAQWGSPLTAGGTVTIDGVTARVYTGDGLFSTKLLYFDHGGIGYQIELTDSNATSEAILTDVIADWSFTP